VNCSGRSSCSFSASRRYVSRAYTARDNESMIVAFLLGRDRFARLDHDTGPPSSDAPVMAVLASARYSIEARVIERNSERHTTVILVGRSRMGVSRDGV